ncbi:LacI family DNA-binding transcriptional regulator [Nocardioides marinus]|uniref:LacI family transcriptional regulator n=1 Tax=Nocardioides marinus TaxID=374514 RepID=A0A7Y9YGD9_9ACTN|nr:LacI family DNA-binding transcriptional regulator [Nocardioides marinus]NYI11763.1 LacI family transcriptional regulator [Nocardioides marinus]
MKPQTTRPRLIDVADAAGVSIATASRALSGTPGVSESLAQRVRATAAELGYAANLHARSLASGSTSTIGLVVHEIGDPYFSEIASGVLRIAADQGRTVQICHTGRDPQVELQQIRSMVASRVGAIVVAGSGFVDPSIELPARRELEVFSDAGGRVAVIGRHHLGVDAVLPANVEGGRAVAEHVLGLGHRRIAVLTGSTGLTTVADRLDGIREALGAAGVAVADVPVIEEAFTRAGGRAGARRVLESHPRTTAVIALNDDMAIGCLSELRTAGVTVPTQISVTGFDDVAVAGDLSPALTTVRLPMVEMGARAVGLTLKEPGKRPRRLRVPAELVVRDSTGPAPA